MADNQYTNIQKALELLTSWGSLSLASQDYGPSLDEETAYNTLLLNDHLDELKGKFFLHYPTKRMMLMPTVGMGATLQYPSDSYPYEVTKVISRQTIEVRAMHHTPVPGWEPDFSPGGFCGHFHNLHDQKFTYTSNPNGKVARLRLNIKGRWMTKTLPFLVGTAKFFRDWND